MQRGKKAGFETFHARRRPGLHPHDNIGGVAQRRWLIIIINVKKTKFIKTVIGDVVAHLKPQKFTVSSDL